MIGRLAAGVFQLSISDGPYSTPLSTGASGSRNSTLTAVGVPSAPAASTGTIQNVCETLQATGTVTDVP